MSLTEFLFLLFIMVDSVVRGEPVPDPRLTVDEFMECMRAIGKTGVSIGG